MPIIIRQFTTLLLAIFLVSGMAVAQQTFKEKEKTQKQLQQEKGKAKQTPDIIKEKAEKEKKQLPEKTEDKLKKKKDELNTDAEKLKKEGQAYGNEKKEYVQKELGQDRAQEVERYREERKKELNEAMTHGADKIKEAKEKVRLSKEKLENDKSSLSEAEYIRRKEKMEKVEKGILDLEKKIKRGEALSSK
jgi:hypothetical protein